MAGEVVVAGLGLTFLTHLLAKLCLVVGGQAAVRIGPLVLPDKTKFWDCKDSLKAKLAVVFGNRFPQQLLDIQASLTESLNELERRITKAADESIILLELNPRLHGINLAFEALVHYAGAPTAFGLEEEFCCSCIAQNGPRDTLSYFYSQIKMGQGETLLDRIVVVCEKEKNLEKFRMWSRRIKNAVEIGSVIRAFELRIRADRDRSSESLDAIWRQLTELRDRRQSILDELDRAYTKLSWGFIQAPCSDASHKNCGIRHPEDSSHCSELGTFIHGFLKKQKADTEILLVAALRDKWPHLTWKVAVAVTRSDFNPSTLNPAPQSYTDQLSWCRLWFHAYHPGQKDALALVPLRSEANFTHGCLVRAAPLEWTLLVGKANEFKVVVAVFWCDEREEMSTRTVWEDIHGRLRKSGDTLPNFFNHHVRTESDCLRFHGI